MRSLRSRLVLAFALVAVVPLAVAMSLTSSHIRRAVEEQAEARLATSLVLFDGELRAEADRVSASVAQLARDPELRRLYLVAPGTDAELRERLATQRFVLGLDYLWIADTAGRAVAEGMRATGLANVARVSFESLPPAATPGLRISPVRDAGALALDVSMPLLYRDERVGWLRGGVLLDSTRLARFTRTSGVDLALFDGSGHRVTATGTGGRRHRTRSKELALGLAPYPSVTGYASTEAADASIAALGATSLALALLGLALAIALGVVLSHQLSRPVERLAGYARRIARGEWDTPLVAERLRELQVLSGALERLRGDLRDSLDRLAAGERQAAYGQMARKVAHEIKNPLTPIAISVADLKRSYDQRHPDFPAVLEQTVRVVGEEVERLKRMIQVFSELGRFPPPRLAPLDLREVLAEIGALLDHERQQGRLRIESAPTALLLSGDRDQLRQALLNLVQNGLDAAAGAGAVTLGAVRSGADVEIRVADSGPGLTPEQQEQLFVPAFTTKPGGSGLGLTIVERIVSDHRGSIAVDSAPGRGTTFLVRLPAASGA